MAEMYDTTTTTTTTTTCSSSSPHHNTSSTTRPVLESDEISVFLHHLLHPPSSSFISQRSKQMPFLSSSSPLPPLPPPPQQQQQQQQIPHLQSLVHESGYRLRDRTSTAESSAAAAALVDSSNLILSSSGFYFPSSSEGKDFGGGDSDAVAVSVKRRKFPVENNDVDDYDCESEEGLEASDGPSKPVPSSSRSSSKRSRAAEVHNLSEKRRRSRINEKMKALQNLIPNSNKTDKASMLDEAIEYLKQLQLQVQMLSMRNGLSLHPLYLPGGVQPLQLPQMRMGFNDGSGLPPPHINMGTTTELYMEGGLPQQQLHTSSPSARNSSARPFDTRHMETSFQRNRLQDMPPKEVDNQNLIQHLQSLQQTEISVMSHSGKIKTGDF